MQLLVLCFEDPVKHLFHGHIVGPSFCCDEFGERVGVVAGARLLCQQCA
jgi:hypothetical protein